MIDWLAIFKALFIFSLSFPLIYLLMYLEDKRKAYLRMKSYKSQHYDMYVNWEIYVEWQKFNQRHL